MRLNNAEQALIDQFWAACGELEPFPRRLERSLLLALPVMLIKVSRLRLGSIESWMTMRGVVHRFNCQDRAVRGCLLAFRGQGIIFVDGTDPNDEQRFTVAHEIGHFLVDYWHPRQKALAQLGSTILPVLDGIRLPTVEERVHALLAKAPLGLHVDWMEREARADDLSGTVWDIEDRADKLALALLAPQSDVWRVVGDLTTLPSQARESTLIQKLTDYFGLPKPLAQRYSITLLAGLRGENRSWLRRIGLR